MRPTVFVPSILVLVAGGVASSLARAEVLCTNTALAIPADGEGLYVNLMTGISGRTEALAPGFDIDIYASSNSEPPGQLKFYWGTAVNGGAGVVTTGDHYAVIGTDSVVDATALFTRAGFTGDTSDWQAGTVGYLGVRFKNETTSTINYGWVLLSTTAPLGFPATIHGWCYENSGVGIATPSTSADLLFADGFEELPNRVAQ
jgi:hypothetical protein